MVASEPLGLIVGRSGVVPTVIHMTRGEGYDFVAFGHERFEFGRKVGCPGSFRAPTLVEGGDADRVTGSNNSRWGHGFIQQDKGKHAIEERRDVFVMFLVLKPVSAERGRERRLTHVRGAK